VVQNLVGFIPMFRKDRKKIMAKIADRAGPLISDPNEMKTYHEDMKF
jgi:hypothetical protein